MSTRTFLNALAVLLVSLSAVLAPAIAFAADKVHLRDGRVIEGTITREGDEFVFITTKIGSIEREQFFTRDQIAKVEREAKAEGDQKPAAANRPADSKASAKDRKDGVERVAVLNFGAPSSWMGKVDSTVGIEITEKSFREAVPMLEKDGVTIVVVRINSGGGLLLEMTRFLELFQDEYKKKFRTVAWVESAISAAAMSPWVLEEFYMMPEGSIGACTGWFGALQAVKDIELEQVLFLMEEASRKAGRDPKIMRAMQIMEPLSYSIDENGDVTWFQDLSGDHIVNPENQILTFQSKNATESKFSRGIASTLDELMDVMGVNEYVIAGQAATNHVDDAMRRSDRANKEFRERIQLYGMALQTAGGIQDRTQRGAEVSRARRFLNMIKADVQNNPNFEFLNPLGVELNREWFMVQEEQLRQMMR